MRKIFSILFVMLSLWTSVAFGQIQSGNNPNFVPTQPSPMGFPTDYGYQNKVIARWTTPPFETINTTTKMGLAAYHFSDIAKVEFFLNGGPASTVFSKTEHKGINAYWIDVGPLPDAELNNLTAIVYPNSGTPFVMGRGTIKDRPKFQVTDTLRNANWTFTEVGVEPLQFASDFNNTLRKVSVYCAPWGNDSNPGTEALPKKNLFPALQVGVLNSNVDGVTIYLYEGDYAWASQYWIGGYGNRYRYLTVKNHPSNVNPARIAYVGTNSAGFRTNKIKLEGLTIQHAGGPNSQAIITTSSSPSGYTEVGMALYVKDCWIDNYQAWFNQPIGMISSGWHHITTENVRTTNMWNAAFGTQTINCHAENIESEITSGGAALFNSTFKNHGNLGYVNNGVDSGAHPDTCQWYSGFEPNVTGGVTNTIIYKLRPLDRFDPVWSQLFFGQGAVNVAIDDTVVQGGKIGSTDPSTTWMRGISITESYNVLIRNSNIGGSWMGISKFPGMGPDTALLQNLKHIQWNHITQNPVDYMMNIPQTAAGRSLLYLTDGEWIAAGSPSDYTTVGTDYDTTGMYGGVSEPRLGPVGIRYQFDWTDPDISYNAKSLGNVLSNWGGIGVGAEGDYNKDGYVNAEDLTFVFSKWN